MFFITGSIVLDDYLSYLGEVNRRSKNTINVYQVDIRLLFLHVYNIRFNCKRDDCTYTDIEYIRLSKINDIPSFIQYCQDERKFTVQLVSLNLSDVNAYELTFIRKNCKQRSVFLTKAVKHSIDQWLSIRETYVPKYEALFISKRYGTRLGIRGIQTLVKKIILKARLNDNISSPNRLRNTSASLLYRYGNVDVNFLSDIQQVQSAINTNTLASIHNHTI